MTARSPVLEAMTAGIISPPTEKPIPPMRPLLMSGRRCQPGDGGVDVLHPPTEHVRIASLPS